MLLKSLSLYQLSKNHTSIHRIHRIHTIHIWFIYDSHDSLLSNRYTFGKTMIPRLTKLWHLKTLRPQMAPASLVACLVSSGWLHLELLPLLVINSWWVMYIDDVYIYIYMYIYIYCVCISVIYSTYIRSLFWSSFWILVIYLKLLSGAIYYLKLSSCNIGLFGVSGTSFQGQSGWKQDMKSRHQSLPLPSRLLPQSRNLTSWKKRPHVVVRFGPTRDQLFPGTLTSASH